MNLKSLKHKPTAPAVLNLPKMSNYNENNFSKATDVTLDCSHHHNLDEDD